MRRFWSFSKRYVLRYIWWYILGGICIVLAQASMVAMVELIKRAIDTVSLSTATANTVLPFTLKIFLCAIVLMSIRTASRMVMFTPGRLLEYRIRNDYFSRLMFLQRDFFSRHESGDLISRCSNDIIFIRAACGFGFLQIANITITFSFALFAMLHMDVLVTLYLAIPMLMTMCITQAGIAFVFEYWRRSNCQLGALSSLCLSSYKNVSIIQAYHAEPALLRKFTELDQQYLNTNLVSAAVRSFLFPLVELVGSLSVFLVLWFVAPKVITGKLSLGEITAFLAYIAMVMPPLISLGWIWNLFNRAIPAMDRLDEVLLAVPSLLRASQKLDFSPGKNRTVLQARGLSFEYRAIDETRTSSFAMRNIDFTLTQGKTLGIIGELGCGKTTLVETILRLNYLNPDQLWINSKDAALCDIEEYRRYFSFAPQRAFLFSASLRDNLKIALPPEEWSDKNSDERLRQYLHYAGFELNGLFPDGLDTVVGERGIMLSGGQRQRVALARALLKEANIYILDDVLSAVDCETEHTIIANLQKFAVEKSFIIVSHRISAIQWANEILVLANGRICQRGTHEELIAQSGYYQKIFEHQR